MHSTHALGASRGIRRGRLMKNLAAFFSTWTLCLLGPGVAASAAPAGQSPQTPITEPVFMCGSGLDRQAQDKQHVFESVPTRPLAVSEDGRLLFVLNTPADCLEIFDI